MADEAHMAPTGQVTPDAVLDVAVMIKNKLIADSGPGTDLDPHLMLSTEDGGLMYATLEQYFGDREALAQIIETLIAAVNPNTVSFVTDSYHYQGQNPSGDELAQIASHGGITQAFADGNPAVTEAIVVLWYDGSCFRQVICPYRVALRNIDWGEIISVSTPDPSAVDETIAQPIITGFTHRGDLGKDARDSFIEFLTDTGCTVSWLRQPVAT